MFRFFFYILVLFLGCSFLLNSKQNGRSDAMEKLSEENENDFNTESNPTEKQKSHFVRLPEVSDVDCSRLLSGDSEYVTSVRRHRPTMRRGRTMTCEAIRGRVIVADLADYPKLDKSIAFARTVNKNYEFVEFLLSSNYHPLSHFCFVMDEKADGDFKHNMKELESCIPNIYIYEKEFPMDSSGYNNNIAHFSCLKLLMSKPNWSYAMLLQNHDIILKTNEELVEIFDIFGGASDILISSNWTTQRINRRLNWSMRNLRLFGNDSLNANPKLIDARLTFGKGFTQASLSRESVEWITNTTNMAKMLENFNWKGHYGIDEFWLATLAASDQIEFPGGFHIKCVDKMWRNHPLTRLSWFKMDGQCHSGKYRHYSCIFGSEDLHSLSETKYLAVNKMLPEWDFAAISCISELIHNKTFVQRPKPILSSQQRQLYSQLNFVRYHREKLLTGFNISTFDCDEDRFV